MKTTLGPKAFAFPAADDEHETHQAPPDAMATRFTALMAEPSVDDVAHAPSSAASPPLGSGRPPCQIESAQSLVLRVSNGPMAGMQLRVFWRDGRLEIRFNPTDPALSRQLDEQDAELGAALSQVLGVTVRVGAERDGAA
ncbi:hypothetical protein [Paludibacterium purpuratum]|uniref:Uncharacterized protein n=1 Tax=Paludibacterium purpuratum TaxID=1144873 RepID=A0A4R7B1K9_9NEIS|nr:hypothetical protein [Paludibacterium purpuratum]TDR76601.1 hypothetical protein DFP86_11026 [Paludibacterium purpuratum]